MNRHSPSAPLADWLNARYRPRLSRFAKKPALQHVACGSVTKSDQRPWLFQPLEPIESSQVTCTMGMALRTNR